MTYFDAGPGSWDLGKAGLDSVAVSGPEDHCKEINKVFKFQLRRTVQAMSCCGIMEAWLELELKEEAYADQRLQCQCSLAGYWADFHVLSDRWVVQFLF